MRPKLTWGFTRMPAHPDYPSRDDEEQPPAPERIIDRIINGRLRSTGVSTPGGPSAD